MSVAIRSNASEAGCKIEIGVICFDTLNGMSARLCSSEVSLMISQQQWTIHTSNHILIIIAIWSNVLRSWLRNLKVSCASRHLIVWVQGYVDEGIFDDISATVKKPDIEPISSIICSPEECAQKCVVRSIELQTAVHMSQEVGVNFLVCESNTLTEILNLRYGITCADHHNRQQCASTLRVSTLSNSRAACVPGRRKFHLQHGAGEVNEGT